MNTRREFLKTAGVTGLAALGTAGGFAQEAPARPRNVVFIFTDDVAWGDLGCYGSQKTKTPSLDGLASRGIRFTDAHSAAPLCSASRYALHSGEYSFRRPCGMVLSPLSPLMIRRERATLASVMKAAGYATGLVGKWHLGLGDSADGPDYNGDLAPGPLECGFDYFHGYATTNDRTPCVYIEDHRVVGLDPKDPIRVSLKPGPGLTNVIQGVRRHTWQSGGTAALWEDEEMADHLTGKAVAFIERHKDRPFFLLFATHSIHHPVLPHPRFRGTSQAGARGDAIHELDWSVGEILATLERLGLARDTLVLFSSDNGGSIDDQFRTPEWDRVYPRGDQAGHRFSGPWRGRKGELHEGGHREPFLARWPARIQPGVSDATISLVDLPATFAAMTGQRLSEDSAPDSFNVLPALLDARYGKPVRDHLFVVGPGGFALREGPWKLIQRPRGKSDLYNLADDPGETRDLFKEQGEVAQRLARRLAEVTSARRSAPRS